MKHPEASCDCAAAVSPLALRWRFSVCGKRCRFLPQSSFNLGFGGLTSTGSALFCEALFRYLGHHRLVALEDLQQGLTSLAIIYS